jgi:hypothetical protein
VPINSNPKPDCGEILPFDFSGQVLDGEVLCRDCAAEEGIIW